MIDSIRTVDQTGKTDMPADALRPWRLSLRRTPDPGAAHLAEAVRRALPPPGYSVASLRPFDADEVERGRRDCLRFVAHPKPSPGFGIAALLAHNPPAMESA